jgi:hypothetical protein
MLGIIVTRAVGLLFARKRDKPHRPVRWRAADGRWRWQALRA